MSQNFEKNIDEKKYAPEAIGERIAKLRRQKGLTQAQIAECLGISGQAVSKWESGLSCPDIMSLVPLAQVLGVSTDVLLGLSGSPDIRETGREDTKPNDLCEGNCRTEEIFERLQEDDGQRLEEKMDRGTEPPLHEEKDVKNKRTAELDVDYEDSGAEDWNQEESRRADAQNFILIPELRGMKQPVRSLIVGAGACSVTICCGNRFSLETEGYGEGDVTGDIEDGVWKIKDVARSSMFAGIGRNSISKRKMRISIPDGFLFERIKLSIGAGTLTGFGIHAQKSILNVGAGQITLQDFSSCSSKIDCGMGSIAIDGEMYGVCHVNCGMGEVKAVLRKPEHYGYQASVGMGEVRIGGSRICGMGGSQTVNSGDSNFYKITCSMGSVSFIFKQ